MRRVVRDGVEIYRVGHRSLSEFLAELREEVRAQGLGKGSLRALFRGMSEWAYLIGAYPTGGWEFVDFLVYESNSHPKGLDRWLLRSSFVEGIRNRAAFVREQLSRRLEELGRQPEWEREREGIAVLDIGCGVGTFGFHALSCVPELDGRVRVVGVDRDPRAISLARRLARRRGVEPSAQFIQADAFSYLNKTEDQFDIALCIGVLAYLPDLQAVALLRSIRARLRDGGVLLASHLHPGVSRAMLGWLRLMGVNLRARTPGELEELLRRAGFNRVEVTRDVTGTQNFMVAEVSPAPLPSADGRGEVVWVEVDRLRDHEEVEPARVEQLARALRRRGRVHPILVEKRHLVVLDGHHRKAALQALGLRKIPCFLASYDRIGLSSWRGLSITKEEVIRRALTGEKFPPKTTRHLYAFHELPEVELPLCPERSRSRPRACLPIPPVR